MPHRLCFGEEISAQLRYTTLSHCWGQISDKYSYCNISATAAENDTVGCFAEPSRLKDSKYSISITERVRFDEDRTPVSLFGSSCPPTKLLSQDAQPAALQGLYDLQQTTTWLNSIHHGAVNQRAWVIQEVSLNLLSSLLFVPSFPNWLLHKS